MGSKRLGVISGSPHPGDPVLKAWGALMGESIKSNGRKGNSRSYGPLGNRLLKHYRENQILQAIFRFGRGGSGARIVLNTSAYPDWITPDRIGKIKKFRGKKKREGVDLLRETDEEYTQNEIATATSASQPSVSTTTQWLQNHGYVRIATNDKGTVTYQWNR